MRFYLEDRDRKRYLRYIATWEKQIAHKREVVARHTNDGYAIRTRRGIVVLEARISEFRKYLEDGYREYENV